MNPAVELKGVGKRYQRHWVLASLDLTIQNGESVALFGCNGSGKSTLLKILATLMVPSTGQMKILGLDPKKDKNAIRKRLRFLGHAYPIYGSLTVLENMTFAAALLGLEKNFLKKGLDELLEKFRISKFRDHRVDQLSEGLKKRVVLSRLLMGASDPELILLDEPHPTLDAESRETLKSFIEEWKRKGTTLLIASHDRHQTLIHTDRSLILEGGRLAGEER